MGFGILHGKVFVQQATTVIKTRTF